MEIEEAVRERIRQRRKKMGLTQAQLAKKVGVCQTAVNDWETGKSLPCQKLVSLALALDVTTDWLLTGNWLLAYSGPPSEDALVRQVRLKLREIDNMVQYADHVRKLRGSSQGTVIAAEDCQPYGSAVQYPPGQG